MSEPLRIDKGDLFSPQVEEYLQQRSSVQAGMSDVESVPLVLRIVYSNYFYLSVACLVGALLAWGIIEPFFDDHDLVGDEVNIPGLMLFPTTAGFIGLFLGAAEGIICRNYLRAFLCAGVGLLVGFIGGFVSLIPAGIVFTITLRMVRDMMFAADPPSIMYLILMFGRSLTWALAAIPAGLGLGLALREPKVVVNGVLGGAVGGLLGGLLFDPIEMVLTTADGQALYSRAVGLGTIGLMVGFFVGLVEQWTKSAWLLMRAGPLAGKQFVLYRNPTVLGSSPKADVYLFKDDAIEPRHALIHNRGGRFEIEDCGTPNGTNVNGSQVRSQLLKAGDQIRLGKTILEFTVKDAE